MHATNTFKNMFDIKPIGLKVTIGHGAGLNAIHKVPKSYQSSNTTIFLCVLKYDSIELVNNKDLIRLTFSKTTNTIKLNFSLISSERGVLT